jgi:flagellar biosynthesis GTPase FlhF
MQIHRIRGRTLRDALVRASDLVGANALVLGHEPAPGGGVTVAVSKPTASSAQRFGVQPRPDPGPEDLQRVLTRSGVSPRLCAEVVAESTRRGARGTYALDAAAEVAQERIRIAPSPRLPHAGASGEGPRQVLLALTGPPGSGKTTTLLKLARHFTKSSRRVGIATLDVRRPGAVEHLVGHARVMQVPVEPSPNGESLVRALGSLLRPEIVLIDTTGQPNVDALALSQAANWAATTRGARDWRCYLTLAAVAPRARLSRAAGDFAACQPSAWVWTKLDECVFGGAVAELAWGEHAMPVALLCDSREIERGLRRATKELVADLLLRSKLP